MFGSARGVAILLGIVCLAAPAAAAGELQMQNGQYVTPTMTYATASDVAAMRTGGSYSGVGSIFVTTASTASTGLGRVCTGSLLSSNVVLTAGHCLANVNAAGAPDQVLSVTYYLPSLAEATPATTFTSTTWTVSPTYTGDATKGGDYAMLTLGELATGYATYSIYTGNPLTDFTRVGTGTIGDATGTGTATDFSQRQGFNEYEFYGNTVTGWSSNILLYDFDDGTTMHDVFGRLGLHAQTGVPGEADSSPGDSGGPSFIANQIVSVTSFGISGDVFRANGTCGTASSIDPYASSSGSCTNSSVGEVGGDTYLYPYINTINAYVASAAVSPVPEPSSWTLMLAGFGLIGATLRRRGIALAV